MTIDEIRRNAPKGSTHYDDNGFYYKRSENGRWLFKAYKMKRWNACVLNEHKVKPL